MELTGPDSFKMTFDAERFDIRRPNGDDKVRGRAAKDGFKLYVFSIARDPIYVGVTKQALRTRLRLGWTADGESGYHGYAFRRSVKAADLNVWYLNGQAGSNAAIDAETIEAEVVFLLRSRGQWPRFQTEIHFHLSGESHRELAAKILGHYGAL